MAAIQGGFAETRHAGTDDITDISSPPKRLTPSAFEVSLTIVSTIGRLISRGVRALSSD